MCIGLGITLGAILKKAELQVASEGSNLPTSRETASGLLSMAIMQSAGAQMVGVVKEYNVVCEPLPSFNNIGESDWHGN